MAIKSITARWILNSLTIILIAIVCIIIGLGIIMKNFYYSGVRQTITARANGVSAALIKNYEDDTVNFNAELRSIVESSEIKNRVEITAIDHKGRAAISSSGFSYSSQEEMPDYAEAINSAAGIGYYTGKNSLGEKIMAVTIMIPYMNAEYSAIRYTTSLEQVDRLLFFSIMISSAVGLGILGFVGISGAFFIKSIVIPVREVGAAARKFATGDMSTRILKKSDDELGELTDIINYMADEISNSEEVKNEFISSVSHELRTPLTAIKGWSETLMDENTDKKTIQKGLKVISSETERLSSMVEELLDFSRMQDGKLVLVKTTFDLLAELGDAVLMYTERARRDGIDLICSETDAIITFFGDRNRMRQVFINVIDNALKYSDTGGRVEISAEVSEKSEAVIKIADTGCGISKEDLPKIKTKFYKANTTRRGSGIGLAVANEIVMMHDGTISVESELNKGTCVTISLPLTLKKGEKRKTEIYTEENENE